MNIVEFFSKVTGLQPTPDQEAFLKALTDIKQPKLAASCGRQTGKSLCSAVAVLWWVFEYPTVVDVLLMSTMDSYVYDHIERIFHKNEELMIEVKVEGVSGLVPLRGFEVKKGSRVHVRGATNKQVRGLGVDIVIVDEAAEITNDMLTTALGNLHGEISKYVMLSTPHKSGLFTDIITDPKKYNFKVFMWSALNCTWQTQELLQSKKKLMTMQQYKMDVLGQILNAEERAYFPTKHLDACIYETVLKENSPMSRLEAGLDWGFDPCHTVLVITEKIFARRKVLFIKEWAKHPIEELAPEIADILEKHHVALVKADTHPTEYTHQIEKYTKTPVFYISAQMHKDAMLSQLQRKIRQHTLELPQDFMKLIQQLRKYRRGKRTGDDQADALALSCYEPAEPLNVKPNPTVIIKLR